MNKLINEAINTPVSFIGGIIAICGVLYSLYVLLLNGAFLSLPFGNYVLKFLILIFIEAPLAYFFVIIHVKMAERGHGLYMFLNLSTILVSALVSSFNVAILSYQDMLNGSISYYVIMVLFSLTCALYLLITEINKQKTKEAYQVDLSQLRELRREESESKIWMLLAHLKGQFFSTLENAKYSIDEAVKATNSAYEFADLLKLVKVEKVKRIPEEWSS